MWNTIGQTEPSCAEVFENNKIISNFDFTSETDHGKNVNTRQKEPTQLVHKDKIIRVLNFDVEIYLLKSNLKSRKT